MILTPWYILKKDNSIELHYTDYLYHRNIEEGTWEEKTLLTKIELVLSVQLIEPISTSSALVVTEK